MEAGALRRVKHNDLKKDGKCKLYFVNCVEGGSSSQGEDSHRYVVAGGSILLQSVTGFSLVFPQYKSKND